MPLFKEKKNPNPSLAAAALPFAKFCELLQAICFHPQRIPLKNSAAQLQSLYFEPSKRWVFWRTRQPSLPEPCSTHTSGKRGRGSTGQEPMKAKHSLEEKPQLHKSLGAHMFFSSSGIPCWLSLRLKLKRTYKVSKLLHFFKRLRH